MATFTSIAIPVVFRPPEKLFRREGNDGAPEGVRVEPLGSPVEWVEEKSYFFRLSAYQDRLLAFFEDNPDFIAPTERRNEIVSFVKSGLRDLSISRTTFDWGIKVPNDPAHVMYVWVDALTNYLTATDGRRRRTAEILARRPQLIGKDIVRFHTVYWPRFSDVRRLCRCRERSLLTGSGSTAREKMSKSLGNVVIRSS